MEHYGHHHHKHPEPRGFPGAIPDSFFGLTTQRVDPTHFPTVPFGSFRIWWIDGGTTWLDIETSRGVYNFSGMDKWLANCKNNNKTVLYCLGRVPGWANGNQAFGVPPTDIATGNNQYKEFVTKLVQYSLASKTAKISYYELWNEPDLKSYWAGTPAQLVQMSHDAFTIIKQLDPSAIVVGPSPSTANQFGVHFLPDYYAAGGWQYQDIIGCHAYLYTGSAFSTTPVGITVSIQQLQALATKYGIGNQRIWFTEGSWGGGTNNASLTNDQKLAYEGQEYLLMLNSGAVDRYYWYSWDNTDWGTLWTTSGILPTGTAYGILSNWLTGSTVTSTLPVAQDANGTYAINFKLASGAPASIAWNPNKTVSLSTTFANFYTLDNTTGTVSGGAVAVGAKPILLTTTIPMHTYVVTQSSSVMNLATITGTVDGIAVEVEINLAAIEHANAVGGMAEVQNLVAPVMLAAAYPPSTLPIPALPPGTTFKQ